jgi:hypothetical protein
MLLLSSILPAEELFTLIRPYRYSAFLFHAKPAKMQKRKEKLFISMPWQLCGKIKSLIRVSQIHTKDQLSAKHHLSNFTL